jgi:hypothetical protein
MTSTMVQPGETFHLTGTFGYGNVLDAYGSSSRELPGAVVKVSSAVTNNGLIDMFAGYGPHSVSRLNDTGVLTNAGTINMNGGSDFGTAPGFGAHVVVGGTLINENQLYVDGNRTAYGNDSAKQPARGATLTIKGQLENTKSVLIGGGSVPGEGLSPAIGGGVLVVEGGFNTSGDVSMKGGYGSVTKGSAQPAGGQLLVKGSLSNSGTINLGGGAYNGAGASVVDTGVLTNTGSLLIQGGIASYYNGNEGFGGTLDVVGVLQNDGAITVHYGYRVEKSEYGSYADGALLRVTGTLVNQGSITVEKGWRGYTNTNAIFDLAPRATLVNAGTLRGSGVIRNDGVITSVAGSSSPSELSIQHLVNHGTVDVLAGSQMLVDSKVSPHGSGHGVFNLYNKATLTFENRVGASQEVAFSGAGGTLALADTHDFFAVIGDFQSGDTIDLIGLDIVSATASGTTITLEKAHGQPRLLTLAAPLPTGSALAVTSDGNGGTDLTVSQAASIVGDGSGEGRHFAGTAHPELGGLAFTLPV